MKRIIAKSNLRFFLIPALFVFIFVRCDKQEIPFPYVSVYANLALDTQLGNLVIGEYVFVDGYGLGGLIVYRADYNAFMAFDRACTHEGSETCILDNTDGLLECPCCGSQFWMVNNDIAGTVYQGPAKYPLKKYSCTFNGTNTVTVRN